jgi:metal-responsive CopG/Arc/MetJ family transcriptional regulator
MLRVSLFLPDDLLVGLDRLKAEHGTPCAESIRRAIAAYLVQKGVRKTTQKGGKKTRRQK